MLLAYQKAYLLSRDNRQPEWITNSIQCAKCKEVVEWDEPKGCTSVDLMPDGVLEDGKWYCNDCITCSKCGTFVENGECDCREGASTP